MVPDGRRWKWMTEDEIRDWAELLCNEWEHVAMRAGELGGADYADCAGVVEKFNLLDPLYGLPNFDRRALVVAAALTKMPSWGELIGGIVCAFHDFPEDEQAQIREALRNAIRFASQEGVNH